MIRTIDFNSFPAGTVIDDEYLASDGVTVSATGGSGQAMIFDSNNPTGGDDDLASDTLDGLLIISEDGDSEDPDDNAGGGTISFDFEVGVRVKYLTFKDIEERDDGLQTRMVFFDEDGNIIADQFVEPGGDGSEITISLDVLNVARLEVQFPGSGAIDNLVFDDTQFNDGPTAVDDSAETDEDTSVVIDLRGNDFDQEDPRVDLTIGGFVSPNGTVVDNGDGTVTFTPDPDFNGEATFTYVLTDTDGNTDTGEVTVDVAPVNDAPVAGPDTLETDEDTPSAPINVLDNDSDPDGDPLTLTEATSPDGTVEFTPEGEVIFTPNPDFNGETVITYVVTDSSGTETTGTVTVTVNPVNDAPDAGPDTLETDEDTPSAPLNVLDNDSDPEGDPLTLTEATSPDGTVEFTPEGEVIFTPNPDFNGETVITYVVTDPSGAETTGTVTVTVNPINDAPVAVDDSDETAEETPVIVDLLANDTDVDGDALTVTEATVPADQGTLVDNGDGTVTFTPATDFTGTATISYTITDGNGGFDSAVHAVEVGNENDAPVTVPDALETDEDTASDPINVLDNDSDPDGDPLTLISASSPNGTVEFTPEGEVIFTPNPNFNGDTTIDYVVTDPSGAETPGVVNVTVGSVNDAPDAVDDADITAEETPIIVDLLANDTDVDGDALTVTEATVPAEEGTLVDNGDGTVTFTPAADFTGDATISYTITDGNGAEDSAVHVVTVTGENDAPVTVPDALETDEDTPSAPLNVLDNDSDPDGDPLTLTEATSPDGTVEFTPEGEVIFTPNPDFNGETTITYVVTDPSGAETTGTVTVTVNPINDAPDAVDDADETAEETPIIVDLLANDTDVDGDDLTVTEVTVPAEEGTLIDNGDGTVTFTPAVDFNGEATISYTISDGNGGTDSAVHTVTVSDENDAPVTVPDALETDEDTPSDPINVLDNDSDPDGDPLALVSASSPNGTVVFTPEGEIIFTPDPDFNGETIIDYVVTDPSGAETPGTVVVTVAPINDAPDAVDDVDVTPEDTPITVDLLANDTDVDGDTLSVVAVSVPEEQGTLVDNGDGTVTFTPAPDFVGEVTIDYTIEDEGGLQDSATHTVYVNEVSDGPTAVDDTAETPEDTPVTIDVLENDIDPDSDLIILEATVPEEQGTVEIIGNELVFTPAPDFNGEATIDYVAQDPDGNTSPAQAVVTVTPVNDAPVAEDDLDITDLDTAITVDLLANDSDVDGDDLTVTEATVPAEQGTLVDNQDGTVTFTPATGFTGDATISYTIADEDGLTDDAVHVIIVNDTPNAPTAVDDTAETPEDTPVTIDVLENDTDPNDDPLTIRDASVPEEQGTVEIVDGTLVFTPAPDFNGPVTITYIVEDPDGNADEGTVAVTVTPVNDAPDAVDDADTTDINTPVIVDLLANDTDVDGDDLTVTVATVPAAEGTLVLNDDGTAVFTPATDFVGDATISYTIADEDGLTDSAEHIVTVTDENTGPVAVDDTAETPEDTPVLIDLIGNDTDADGDPLTLVEATVPEEQGTLVDNGDGTVTFTPAPDFNGPATITYTVADPDGVEDEGQAVVTVTPVNDAPVAEDDTDLTDLNTPVTVDLLANDTDVDGDILTVTAATVPTEEGTLVDNGDGTVTFTPATDFVGDATISYTIEDEEGLTDTAIHTIIVSDPANAPIAVDDRAETPEDTPVTIDALDNDTDPTDDPLTIREATVPAEQGTVEIVDNELVFTPADDFNGPATITYIVEDPDGNADEGTVRVNVTPVNDTPDAVDDTATTEEDTPIVIDLLDNDSDADGDPLTVTAVSVPAEQGTVVNNDDGTATFTPAPGFNGEATVTYTIADPDGAEDTATHVIDVTPINDAPDAVDDTDTTPFNTPITVDLLANDIDPDGDPLTVIDVSVPAEQGTLVDNGDGTVTFTPALAFAGAAVITYTVEDDGGLRDTALHTITIEAGVLDGIVQGTDGDDLIDIDYLGDPEGDRVDNNDEILPGQGPNDDIIIAGDGNDTILAGEANDDIDAGAGNDSVVGGPGDDTVDGGDGDDTILGGEGDDSLLGGAGEDVFEDVDAGDFVDGGDGPIDNDTLDLRGSAPVGGSLEVVLSETDPEDGVVNYFDEDGEDAGQLVFEDIENIIPCFTPGTRIATAKGERLVEDLKVGDRVITRDNGIQTICWVGAREMPGAELAHAEHLRPVLIREGALGNGLPERDMMVSPNHRMLVANDKTALYFEEREVLVAAKHLTGLEGVDIVDVSHTTYIHIMFDRHEVILSDGTWTESFQPGDMSLAGVGNAQRQEILELFPSLGTQSGIDSYASARRSLKKFEAKLITK